MSLGSVLLVNSCLFMINVSPPCLSVYVSLCVSVCRSLTLSVLMDYQLEMVLDTL